MKNAYTIVEDPIITTTYLVLSNLYKKNYKKDILIKNINLEKNHNKKVLKILNDVGFYVIKNNNNYYYLKYEKKDIGEKCYSFDSEITDSMPFIVLLFTIYGISSILKDDVYMNRTKSYNHLIKMGYTNLKIMNKTTVKIFNFKNNNIKKIPFVNYDLRGDACNLITNLISGTYDNNFDDKYISRGYPMLINICNDLIKN